MLDVAQHRMIIDDDGSMPIFKLDYCFVVVVELYAFFV